MHTQHCVIYVHIYLSLLPAALLLIKLLITESTLRKVYNSSKYPTYVHTYAKNYRITVYYIHVICLNNKNLRKIRQPGKVKGGIPRSKQKKIK